METGTDKDNKILLKAQSLKLLIFEINKFVLLKGSQSFYNSVKIQLRKEDKIQKDKLQNYKIQKDRL